MKNQHVESLLNKIRLEDIRLIIVRGLSGSGKTYLANVLAKALDAVVCEADIFMYANNSTFNPKMLDKCHQMCKDRVQKTLNDGKIAIVSNTNASFTEFVPYVALADASNLLSTQVLITESENPYRYDVDQCVMRCIHGTPRHIIQKQLDNMKLYPTDYIRIEFSEDGYDVRTHSG